MDDQQNKKISGNEHVSNAYAYVKKFVDTVREPFLVLDERLNIITSNDSFHHMFQVDANDLENRSVFEIGKGEWDIPELHELLEKILPENNFFKGFEISHEFPNIGKKVMIVNARHLRVEGDRYFPALILIAMEDITDLISVAEKIIDHTNQFEIKMTEIVQKLEINIMNIQNELDTIKGKMREI